MIVFQLILNELIANGTVHGNKGYAINPLQLKSILDGDTISITIKDEGSGFDYHSFRNAFPTM